MLIFGVFPVLLSRICTKSREILQIQAKCLRISTKRTPNTDTFYAVSCVNFHINCLKYWGIQCTYSENNEVYMQAFFKIFMTMILHMRQINIDAGGLIFSLEPKSKRHSKLVTEKSFCDEIEKICSCKYNIWSIYYICTDNDLVR